MRPCWSGLVELASEFAFATYLIRSQGIDRSYYDTAWTLSVLRGGLIAIVLVVSASAAAEFFAEPRLQNVLYALALVSLIDGLANIGIVDFQKSMNFDRDFRLTVQTKLVSFAVTVLLAVLLRNYWALVIGMLSGRFAALLFGYTMHPYRPRVSLARTGAILRFSKWVLASNMLYSAQRQGYAFVIGKILNSASVGLYSLAREISAMATSEIVLPVHRAMLPGLSALERDPAAMRRTFLDGLAVIVMLALPLGVGIALVADPLVRVAMGRIGWRRSPCCRSWRLSESSACSPPTATRSSRSQPAASDDRAGLLRGGRRHRFDAVGGVDLGSHRCGMGNQRDRVASVAPDLRHHLAGGRNLARNRGRRRLARRCRVSRDVRRGADAARYWPRTDTASWLVMELGCACVLGALVYVAVLLGSWRNCGMPPGAEKHALQVCSSLATRIGLRRAADRT